MENKECKVCHKLKNKRTQKCLIKDCNQTFSFCSLTCQKAFKQKLYSCARCGVVDFCEHGMPVNLSGGICTTLDDEKICGESICMRCSKESLKLFHKFVCCRHE